MREPAGCRAIARIALQAGSIEPKKVMSMVQDEKLNKFLARLLVNPAPSANPGKDIEDCVKKIKKQIAEKERAGNEEQARKLIQEFQDLLKNGLS